MNGGPAWVDRGWSWNLESFSIIWIKSLPKRTTSLERFTVSKYPSDADQLFQACKKMTNFVWARCQQVDVLLRSFVFPLPRDNLPRIESHFSTS